MRFIFLPVFFLFACQTPGQQPANYRFPAGFFVEQNLSIQIDGQKKRAHAQLEKKQGDYTLVLSDPMTSMVLAKVSMKKHEAPTRDYIAPVVKDQNLPLQEIGESIRFLYESPEIPFSQGAYERKDPEGRWLYRWTEISGDPCPFPKDLQLRFLKAPYELRIELKSAECLP